MKSLALTSLFCLLALTLQAQRVSRDYRDLPMPEVLKDLSRAATRERIVFIYNDLEAFTVTEHFDSLTIADAIRTCIGFYPINLTIRGDSVMLVECKQKKRHYLKGRLVDERNVPIGYANITLFASSGSTIINKGVSNQNGRFVIPTDSDEVLVRISHVSYKPVSRRLAATDVGTIRLETAVEQIASIDVESKPMNHAENEYHKFSQRVARNVWSMPLPQFHIDTIPAKYRGAPAVVLAEYDSIEYRRTKQAFYKLFSGQRQKWLQTDHLHRTRYLINHEDAVQSLSQVVYSTQTDITNFVMYKLTVMGIRITKPDGTQRTVDTFRYFKPRIHNPKTATDTIHIVGLEPGDILDIFVYHRYNEPLSPYRFRFPSVYPTLSYMARAVADTHTQLQYQETNVTIPGKFKGNSLTYHLRDYDGQSPNIVPTVILQAQIKK